MRTLEEIDRDIAIAREDARSGMATVKHCCGRIAKARPGFAETSKGTASI